MWSDVVAILGLGAACGGWIVVQRFVERHNPGRGHPTGGCGSCSLDCDKSEHAQPGGHTATSDKLAWRPVREGTHHHSHSHDC